MAEPVEPDWDEVEELVFQVLELRTAGEGKADGDADADAAVDALLAAQPAALVDEVRRVLAEMSGWGSAVADDELRIPDALGPYRVGAQLGQGGMGAVYEAVDEALGRRVAVKVIRPDLLALGAARERFRREVEAVARLSHPGIVPVYQVGEQAGVPWFAMELVEGRSLAAVLQGLRGRDPDQLRGADLCDRSTSSASGDRDPFGGSWERACVHVARQLADALAHAHGRAVLHRDVKPSNVLLDRSGQARLLDFGLSRTDGQSELTRSGALLGSLPYAPPEQVRGDAAAHGERADVYSLGVTLYELLTLRSPFLAQTEAATRRNVEDGEAPALRALNRSASWEVATVTAVAMERDPERRYQNMVEFAADLQRVLDRRPIVARPPSVWRRLRRAAERHPAAFTGAVVGVAALLALFLVYTIGLRDERDRALRAQQEAERLRDVDRERSYRAGLFAAQLALQAGQVTEAEQALQQCPEEMRGFEWRHLHARVDESVAAVRVSDRFVRRVVVTKEGLFAGGIDGVMHHVTMGSMTQTAFAEQAESGLLDLAATHGTALLVSGHMDGEVRLWDGAARTLRGSFDFDGLYGDREVAPHQRSCFAVAITGDGATAYAAGAAGAVAVIDVARAERTGGFLLPTVRGGLFALDVSPDGRLLAIGVDHDVLLVRPDGEVVRRLTGHRGFVFSVSFSPDGNYLLSGAQDRTARFWRVGDGECASILFGHDGEVHGASFAGDGSVWTVSNDGTLRNWDLRTSRERQRRLGHVGAVYAVASARYEGAEYLVTAGLDGSVRKWDARVGKARYRIGDPGRTLQQQLVVHDDGARCTMVDAANGVRTWSLPDGAALAPLVEPGDDVRALAVAGDAVVVVDLAGDARRVGADAAMTGNEAPINDVVALADGRVVALEDAGHVVVWAPGERAGRRAAAHDGPARVLLAVPGGFVTAGYDGRVLFWGAEEAPEELIAGDREWAGGCFEPADGTLYLAGDERVVALDLAARAVRWDRQVATRMRGAATADGGRRLLLAGSDRVLHVWDAAAGVELVGLAAGNLLQSVVVAGDVVVTATVYSAVDLWLGR